MKNLQKELKKESKRLAKARKQLERGQRPGAGVRPCRERPYGPKKLYNQTRYLQASLSNLTTREDKD